MDTESWRLTSIIPSMSGIWTIGFLTHFY